jgi:signal transduction histidine kinase
MTNHNSSADIFIAISSAQQISEFREAICKNIGTWLSEISNFCLLKLYDKDKGCLRLLLSEPTIDVDDPKFNPHESIPLDSVTGSFIRSKDSDQVIDVGNCRNFKWEAFRKKHSLKWLLLVKISKNSSEEPLGCISIYSSQKENPFNEEVRILLKKIGAYISCAFEHLKASRIMNAYKKIKEIFGNNPLSHESLQSMCTLIKSTVSECSACSIFLTRPGGFVQLSGTTDLSVPVSNYYDIQYRTQGKPEGITGWVAKYGKSVRILRGSNTDEYKDYGLDLVRANKFKEKGTEGNRDQRSYLSVPIKIANNHVIGVIKLTGPSTGEPFTQTDQEILEKVCEMLSADMDRERQTIASFKSLSHQLLAPLNSICTNLGEMLNTQIDGPDKIDVYRVHVLFRNINASANLALSIADSFYLMQKIVDGSEILINRKPTNIFELLKRSISMEQPAAWDEDISTFLDESMRHLSVYADENLIFQVLLNLIDNAIKYSLRKTVIKITLKEQRHEYIDLCFSNIGIPINENEKENIFSEGYRTTQAIRTQKPGSGLGLSLAKKILELHEGKISVTSTLLNDGTGAAENRFIVRLPRYQGMK